MSLLNGTRGPSTENRLAEDLARLERLPAVQRRLRGATSVAAMLAEAADLTRTECGFSRALVLAVSGDTLTSAATHALADPASDRLRRVVQADPITLVAGTVEHRLVRSAAGRPGRTVPSLLADTLGLQHHAYGIIAPERKALALLVVDRPDRPLDAFDRVLVTSMAAMIGVTLEHLILHARMTEVSMELRHLTSSAQALMSEVLYAPLSIPTERRGGTAFPRPENPGGTVAVRELLTAREIDVAALLVQGRSNRQIADELIISTATVKDCVVRIRRKLNATNRVDAAARYLQLSQPAGQ